MPLIRLTTREAKRATRAVAKQARLGAENDVRPRISPFLSLLTCEILLEIPGLGSGCQSGVPNPVGLVGIP